MLTSANQQEFHLRYSVLCSSPQIQINRPLPLTLEALCIFISPCSEYCSSISRRHASHITCHTSHVTRHTSHVTNYTSHVTRHTSQITRHTPGGPQPLDLFTFKNETAFNIDLEMSNWWSCACVQFAQPPHYRHATALLTRNRIIDT